METHQVIDGGLTDVQAAKALGVSPATMRMWRFKGRGPRYVKLGRRCVYYVEDLEQFKQQNCVHPDQAALGRV